MPTTNKTFHKNVDKVSQNDKALPTPETNVRNFLLQRKLILQMSVSTNNSFSCKSCLG